MNEDTPLDQSCPWREFTYLQGLAKCITDTDEAWSTSLVQGTKCLVVIFLGLILMIYSRKVKRLLISPSKQADPNETYCVLTLNVIQSTQLMLIVSICLLI